MKKILKTIGQFFKRLFSGNPKDATPVPVKLYPTYTIKEIDYKIFIGINDLRQQHGFERLLFSSEIANVAASHSQYMAKARKTSHDNHLERQNYFKSRGKRSGEIVVSNRYIAASVVQGWYTSPAHKKSMLKPTYVHMGIATAYDDANRPYYTAIFTD